MWIMAYGGRESHFKMTGNVFIIDLNLEESISAFQCLYQTVSFSLRTVNSQKDGPMEEAKD